MVTILTCDWNGSHWNFVSQQMQIGVEVQVEVW